MRRTAYSVGSKHSKTNSGCLRLKNSQHAEKPPRKPNSQQPAKTPQQLMQQQAKLRKKNQASGRAVRNADLPRQARKANRLKSKKPKPRKPHHRHQRSDRSVTANADSQPEAQGNPCLQKNPGFQRHGATQSISPLPSFDSRRASPPQRPFSQLANSKVRSARRESFCKQSCRNGCYSCISPTCTHQFQLL